MLPMGPVWVVSGHAEITQLARHPEAVVNPSFRGAEVPLSPLPTLSALLGRMLHEWVGYGGTIKKWGVSYRGMDAPGQEMTCKGVVTGKRQEGAENLVDLDIWTANPEGEKTTPGTATVALPSRP